MSTAKRLYRSRHNKILAGVCGGIADYFNIDPVFVRILFFALCFAFGAAIVFYLLMWLITPLQPVE